MSGLNTAPEWQARSPRLHSKMVGACHSKGLVIRPFNSAGNFLQCLLKKLGSDLLFSAAEYIDRKCLFIAVLGKKSSLIVLGSGWIF